MKKSQQIIEEEIYNLSDKRLSVIGAYIDAKTPIKIKCNWCDDEWDRSPDSLLQILKRDKSKLQCLKCISLHGCSIDGCGNKATAKGLCDKHRQRIKFYGDPNYTQIKERRRRNEEIAKEEILEFYKAFGIFSTNELMQRNSGLERWIRQNCNGIRNFCENNNISYILKDSMKTNWDNESATKTIIDLHKKTNSIISRKTLNDYNLGKLYQWITGHYENYATFCKQNNIENITNQHFVYWNDSKCFRLIKDLYEDLGGNVKPEYIKKTNKGAYGYLYTKHNGIEDFAEKFDLVEYIGKNISTGELQCKLYLDNNKLTYKMQHIFSKCKNINPLPFDFVVYINNKIKWIIEYDGEHHTRPVRYGGISEERAKLNFEKTKINDKIKNTYCENKKIKLIRIPYTEFKNIDSILEDILIKNNLNSEYIINNLKLVA